MQDQGEAGRKASLDQRVMAHEAFAYNPADENNSNGEAFFGIGLGQRIEGGKKKYRYNWWRYSFQPDKGYRRWKPNRDYGEWVPIRSKRFRNLLRMAVWPALTLPEE